MNNLNRYYWIVLINTRGEILQKVQKEHPFYKLMDVTGEKWCMLNYKEITEEEFTLFTDSHIANYDYIEPDIDYFKRVVKYL